MRHSIKLAKILFACAFGLLFSVSGVFSQTRSSGCSNIDGFASFVGETTTVNVGTVSLEANETIRFSGTLDDTTPMTIRLSITGAGNFTIEGTVPAVTIQAAGVYTLTITNSTVPSQDGNATGACQDATTNTSAPVVEWSGYLDGRLDPDPSEPFAVYCENNELILYEVPDQVGVISARYELNSLLNMSINGELRQGSPVVILRRLSDDGFNLIFSGTFKAFSLVDCFVSAGIEVPPPAAPETTSSFGIQVTICPQEFDPQVDCPDTDGDRVYDVFDECPNDRGFGRLNGCPDTDGDGYEDRVDWCPDLGFPLGRDEVNGCVDPDGDGLVASPFAPVIDECPLVAGSIDNNGCPIVSIVPIEDDTPIIDLFTFASITGNFLNIFVDTGPSQCIEWTLGPYGGLICTEFD